MLTRKDLENADYPLILIDCSGVSHRSGWTIVLHSKPRFDTNSYFTPQNVKDYIDKNGNRRFDINSARKLEYWKLVEISYDPNQNGDTEDDI